MVAIVFYAFSFCLLSFVALIQARCLNWCNQRGVCSSPAEGGNCICNMGFAGEDCSERLCPAAFEPLSLPNLINRRSVRLETGNLGGIMIGKLEFSFGGSSAFLDANANKVTDESCRNSLLKLKSISDIRCVRETFNEITGVGSYIISLLEYPLMPFMNNIMFHRGDPPRSYFSCNSSFIDEEEATGPYCRVSDVDISTELTPLPVYSECSNHGSCDRIYGKCKCEKGFKGIACNDTRDNEDIITHTHDGPFFTANIMKIHAERVESDEFNLLQMQINHSNVTTITGDRRLIHSGDLSVTNGGSIAVSMVDWKSSSSEQFIAKPANYRSHISVVDPFASSSHYHILATRNSRDLSYSLDANGNSIQTGNIIAANNTFSVEVGMISAVGMKLSDSLDVAGAMNVEDSLTIGSGFALMPGGMTVDVASHTGTLFELRSRQHAFNGSMLEIHSVGESSSMIKAVSNGMTTFELLASGDVKMQGLHLSSGGIQIDAGGLQVEAGGIRVKGGLTIESGLLDVSSQHFKMNGLTVSTNDESSSRTDAMATFEVKNRHYSGDVISITDENTEDARDRKYNILKFSQKSENDDDNVLFQVDNEGSIISKGGLSLQGVKGLSVDAGVHVKGDMSLTPLTVIPIRMNANDNANNNQPIRFRAHVPSTSTYITIAPVSPAMSDHKNYEIEIIIRDIINDEQETAVLSSRAGRLLIITNRDSKTTIGTVKIPSMSTILMIYDGEKWVDVEALKAPMEVLQNVQKFEVANDIDIGNYTLSAKKFRSSQLVRNGVIVAGINGGLITSDRLQFSKGILSTTALKFEKLSSGFDAKSNTISDAVLTNPKLVDADIQATTLTVSSQQGLAFFNNKGQLTGSSVMSVDGNGRLVLREVVDDLNMNFHSLLNPSISNASNIDSASATIKKLYLPDLIDASLSKAASSSPVSQAQAPSEGSVYSIIAIDPNGQVCKIPTQAMQYDTNTNSISAKLFKTTLTGPIDASKQIISDPIIKQGIFEDTISISTDQIIVKELMGGGLVSANEFGQLIISKQFSSSSQEPLLLNHISVKEISFSNDNNNILNLKNQKIINVIFDSVEFETVNKMKIKELFLTENNNNNHNLLISEKGSGKIKSFDFVLLDETEKSVAVNGHLSAKTIQTDALHLPSLSSEQNDAVLSVNKHGQVQVAHDVSLRSLQLSDELLLSSSSKVKFEGFHSSILTIDENGFLSTLSQQQNQHFDLNIHSLFSDSLSVSSSITAKKGTFEEINLQSEESKKGSVGNVVILGKGGSLVSSNHIKIDISTGDLQVPSIHPPSGEPLVRITSANITDSFIHSTSLADIPSIHTNSLVVEKVAEFGSNVNIDGQLNVQGSVVGSGPYMDSSDERLKRDIVRLEGKEALQMLDNIHGYRYYYKNDNNNSNNSTHYDYPTTQQIGIIAQEVFQVAPELVINHNNSGDTYSPDEYMHVSYGHFSVIISEAFKEYKKENDVKINILENEVKLLNEQLNEMKEMTKRLLDKLNEFIPPAAGVLN
eukprot:gene8919-12027_t